MGVIIGLATGAAKGIAKLVGIFSAEKRADERQRYPKIEAQCDIIDKSSIPFTNPTFHHRRLENGNDLEHRRLSEFAQKINDAMSSIQRIASPELRKAMYELHQSCLGILMEHWDDNIEPEDLSQEIKNHRLAITKEVIDHRRTFNREANRQLRLK